MATEEVGTIKKEWPKGSLEEEVQNAIKTWDMEIEHKTRVQDILRPSTLTRSSSLKRGISSRRDNQDWELQCFVEEFSAKGISIIQSR
ncbi:hypothetical protein NC651_003892 [Populus alba x Populus x berolinensis]|nr:hypothetical protein NC651_003892 [Populus alba x Populus x berolinensis]